MAQDEITDWQEDELDPMQWLRSRRGWTKNWRQKWEHPSFRGRPNHILVFDWLVGNAVYDGGTGFKAQVRFKGENIVLNPGQLTCGMYEIAKATGVRPPTVYRVLNDLVHDGLIEKRTSNQCSLITVMKWGQFQANERQSEKQNVRQSDFPFQSAFKSITRQPIAKEEKKERIKIKESACNDKENEKEKPVSEQELNSAKKKFLDSTMPYRWFASEELANDAWNTVLEFYGDHHVVRIVTLMSIAHHRKKPSKVAEYFEKLLGYKPSPEENIPKGT